MPVFDYTARDADGHVQRGTMEAPGMDELVDTLQDQGLTILSVGPPKERKKVKSARRRRMSVRSDDMILFSRQMATLLESGVTLHRSLEILLYQIESGRLYNAVTDIKADIEGGQSFHIALAKHPKVFNLFWINLVETGEASGHLPTTLNQIAEYHENTGALQRKVTSALVYPAILIGVAVCAIFIFTVKVIPIFSGMYSSFGAQLPGLTVAVISVSDLVRKNILIILGVTGVAGFIFYKYLQTEVGRANFDFFKFKIPLIGRLFHMSAVERFASGLGTLVESGVPILYALEITEKSVGNRVLQRALEQVKDAIRKGQPMAEPLEQTGVFPPMVVQMIKVGEEIGELGKMLRKLSEFYRERITTLVERITALIEPLVLLVMGGVIGIMVLAMFLPIFNLSSAIQ
ncbi:MAG: type II secretion system F family protein [Candidatus Omnitrophica bacterium]|nr:type II secretion system F family protein [Candidatus Omnitrophota bacterium]